MGLYLNISEIIGRFYPNLKGFVNWSDISEYQKLSEEFSPRILKVPVNSSDISEYQKLSEDFLSENLKQSISENNWQYKSKEFVFDFIKNKTSYEILNDEVIAYKSCRSDGYSNFNFQYFYEVGKVYESHADCNADNDNSFGLSAWTKRGSDYCDRSCLR